MSSAVAKMRDLMGQIDPEGMTTAEVAAITAVLQHHLDRRRGIKHYEGNVVALRRKRRTRSASPPPVAS